MASAGFRSAHESQNGGRGRVVPVGRADDFRKMIFPWNENQISQDPRGAQGGVKGSRLSGQGQVIPLTIKNQKGRRWTAHMLQGRGVAADFLLITEHVGEHVALDVEHSTDANDTANIARRKSEQPEVALVQGEQGGEMTAGGMAAHINAR